MLIPVDFFLPNKATTHPQTNCENRVGQKQYMSLPCEQEFNHSGACNDGSTGVRVSGNLGCVPVRYNSQCVVRNRV